MSQAAAPFLRLLRRGPFARYMAGETISMVGAWMQMFAQGWLLTTLTPEATALGWLTFAGGVPTLIFSMFAGSLADRFDKRRILLAVLIAQLIFAVLIGWLAQTGAIRIWHLYAVTAALGLIAAFEVPAVSSFVPELVAKDDLARALAIDRASFHFTRMIGPALAGWLVGQFGVPTAYYLNAASFLALMWAILTIGPRARGTVEEEEMRQGPMRAGFDFVRRDAPTRAMILLMAAMSCFASPFFMVTLPVYARSVLGLDAARMGVLMAFSGVGSFIGALSLLTLPPGRRAIFLKCGSAAAVLGLGTLALAPSFDIAAVGIALMTLGLSTTFGTSHIVVQERAPDPIRGRVSAVASLSFFGTMPFAGLAMAALADHFGLRRVMLGGAACFALAAAALLAGRKQLASAPPSA
ncbi:MAG: MFS transporter [Chthoniobacteraceae bacterium]